jgi:hypothetical protein
MRFRENMPGHWSRIRSKTGCSTSSASSASIRRIAPAGSCGAANVVYSWASETSPHHDAIP